MSLTDRDRKLLMFVLPLVVVVAYWFLLLAPKRDEAASLADKVAEAHQARDKAEQLASHRNAAKNKFAADYATIVRVGKAVPTSVDMPSLLVQLDAAAAGTGIEFDKIVAGKRASAAGGSSGQASSPRRQRGRRTGPERARQGGRGRRGREGHGERELRADRQGLERGGGLVAFDGRLAAGGWGRRRSGDGSARP